MNVNLSPEMERKVRERVGNGYQTESAVIEEAGVLFRPRRLECRGDRRSQPEDRD